jgi:hypothetical protein
MEDAQWMRNPIAMAIAIDYEKLATVIDDLMSEYQNQNCCLSLAH